MRGSLCGWKVTRRLKGNEKEGKARKKLPDFLPQYEHEIQETKLLIERGKAQGREVWVEKNQHLLERYEEIVSILRSGQTRHLAGKKGREYIGEERKNVN